MSKLLMPKVRAILPSGDAEYILPQRAGYGHEAVPYDPLRHKGRLKCLFCDAAVHHNPGSAVIASGHPGRQAHFVTTSDHDDACQVEAMRETGRTSTRYDDAAGYRIHINVPAYSELFNLASGPYERDAEGRLRLKDPALAGMRPKAVTEIGDVAALIRRGDFQRLKDSVVMLRDREKPLPWKDFFIRYGRGGDQSRYLMLADRTLCHEYQPAALEIVTEGTGYVSRERWRKGRLSAESKPIYVGMTGRRPEFLVPRIWLDNQDDTRVRDALQEPGRYLVLGIPRITMPYPAANGFTRYLDVKVTDTRQVMSADLKQLTETGLRNAARRQPG
jgi:hypothetical protein